MKKYLNANTDDINPEPLKELVKINEIILSNLLVNDKNKLQDLILPTLTEIRTYNLDITKVKLSIIDLTNVLDRVNIKDLVNNTINEKALNNEHITSVTNEASNSTYGRFTNFKSLDKNNPLFDIVMDFVYKHIFTPNFAIILLKLVINIFNESINKYIEYRRNLGDETAKDIKIVLKGGFLMYNLFNEIIDSLNTNFGNILFEKFNDSTYSYDLDFTISINRKNFLGEGGEALYREHYSNLKKIIGYSVFLINYVIVTNNLLPKPSDVHLKSLIDTLNNTIKNDFKLLSPKYKNINIYGVELIGSDVEFFDYKTEDGRYLSKRNLGEKIKSR